MALALTLRLASGGGSGGFALALAVALVWQVSAWKQAALNRCHRRPTLAAFAPAAYRDAVLFGASHGLWCVSACWALMLASLTVPAHHVAGMAIVAIFNWSERLEAPRTTRWRLRAPTVAARLAVRLIGRVAMPVSKLSTYRRSTAVLGTLGPQKGPK
jgi:predicted metal-binding membrane protein